jgi:hypothetical protein
VITVDTPEGYGYHFDIRSDGLWYMTITLPIQRKILRIVRDVSSKDPFVDRVTYEGTPAYLWD